MAKIPVRFRRVAAVFDSEMERARLCESSGSEHSPDDQSLTDLSDLVNSFLEREYNEGRESIEKVDGDIGGVKLLESDTGFSEAREALRGLFCSQADGVKTSIHGAVEKALVEIGSSSTPEFKRRLMARLRLSGFDAGLCKSKWENAGHCPSGSYEYVDVFMSGNRYIVDVCLAKEFDIARPSNSYRALLNTFPSVFVGKEDELKQITGLMCTSIKKSMKSAEMHVPPWRRLAYMRAKWFSSYRRTVNEFPKQKSLSFNAEVKRKRSIGFAPVPAVPFFCRESFAAYVTAGKVGNLALALNDDQ